MTTQKKIEKHCQDLYRRTYELWLSLKHSYPDWGYGYNVLYGPPRLRPDCFILSFQGAGGDRTIRKTWPRVSFFSEDKYPLGQKLKRMFSDAGHYSMLRDSTGSSIVFFQSPNMKQWKKNPASIRKMLEKFSLKEVKELLSLMEPKIILTIGVSVFNSLGIEHSEPPIKGGWCNIVKKGYFGKSKVIGVPHTASRLSRDDTQSMMHHFVAELDSLNI